MASKTLPETNHQIISLLKDSIEVVANRYLDVINTSLEKGVFPDIWRNSIIVPVSIIQKFQVLQNKCMRLILK